MQQPSLLFYFLQKMDFRMRTLKQNKNSYNSLVQLQQPIDSTFTHSINHSLSRKDLHEHQAGNQAFEGYKLPNWQNGSVMQGINQRIGQLEQRVDRIYLETMGLSHKGDLGKDIRNSQSFQSNSQIQENSLFRQSVIANIAMQKQEMQSHGARCQEMEARQTRLEQRLRDWMAGQKQQLSYRLQTQAEELKGVELSKIKRYDYQYDNIKNIIHEMQVKLETDIEYKFKAFAVVKQDFSHSINGLREEFGREIGQSKEGIANFAREIKDSFQSLKEALIKDRQNVKEAISELQSNGQNTAIKAQKNLENATRTFAQKHDKLQKKISNFKEEWSTFKMITNQQLEEYKEIVVNVEANILESMEGKKSQGYGGNGEEIKEEFSEWRKLTEQKNLNIFREITNAIKVQRLQWRKEHDEMHASMQENLKSVKQLKSSVSKKIEKLSAEQSVLLKESLEGIAHRLEEGREFTNILKRQFEQRIENSNIQLAQNLGKQVADLTNQLQATLKEMQTKQQAFKQGQQDSIIDIKHQITNIKAYSDTQLQNLAKSIAEDNEQWELQLKANEKKLKENIYKQIEDSASGKQQLIDAKYKQMQDSLLGVKKFAEKGLSDERNETVKQILKVTEELTGLVTDWSSKSKKEREALESSLKEQLLEAKKSSTKANQQVKVIAEDIKKKTQQKQTEEEKKSSELKTYVETAIAKISKSSEEDAKATSKKIDTLKSELQGKMKASIDKLLLEINSKKQSQMKAKEEEKSKSLEQEKKLSDLYTKLKGEFAAQLAKTSKVIEDESAKSSKKSEVFAGSLKKQMQGQLQKQRKYCVEQLAKLKGELELKIKAKEEKAISEQTSKKQAEAKQREQQLKAKFVETDKKLTDSLSKLKSQMIGEIGKNKNAQIDELVKVRKQLQLKVKSIEDQKEKKEADARGKQQQLKEKEKELKDKSAELDIKLQSTKKDIQKIISQEITKAKAQMSQKVQKSGTQGRSASEKQLEGVNKSIQQVRLRHQQGQKKLQELRVQTDKKIAELKGVSVTSMKSQQQQAKKAQEQRLEAVKAQLLKLIQASSNKLKQSIESNSKMCSANQLKLAEYSALLKTHEALMNKLQAGLFADRENNKAVYGKITTDLLDIADSITLVLTEMRPAEK